MSPRPTATTGGDSWSFAITLAEDGDGTHLEFVQELTDPEVLPSVGPGWEYYLDRLAANLGGEPIEDVQFDDYYPAMSGYFTELV
ncbi:hypothetical protein GCM10023169_37950 [Georgenia halophila]|uniref:Activator of Hsp90 ATPase homolog 1-like protein n=1 Tax=Georgenia halophila TaxID=620889 RepID=A0ABP8LMV5_9MICO